MLGVDTPGTAGRHAVLPVDMQRFHAGQADVQGTVDRRAGALQHADHAERFVIVLYKADTRYAMGEDDAVVEFVAQCTGHFRAKHDLERIAFEGAAFGQLQRLFAAVAVMLEIGRVGAHYAIATMGVAQGNRNRPSDPRVFGEALVAVPTDVVGRIADAEDRVQQQIDRAGARTDHQIGAANGAGEAGAGFVAHPFDGEQQAHREGDGEHSQQGGEAAIVQARQGQTQEIHRSALHCARRAIELGQRQAAVEQWRQALVMADEQQARAGCAALGEQQLQKDFAAIRIQRRGRLVGDDQLRLADQCAGSGDALLLADGERIGTTLEHPRGQSQMLQQARRRGIRTAVALARTFGTQRRKMAGQADVLAYRKKRQQVELLEDVAGVIDAEAVTGTGRQTAEVAVEQADTAAAGLLHTADQAEQGGLAAARRALEKQAFAAFEAKRGNVQQLGLAGPGEAEVVDCEEWSAHRGPVLVQKGNCAWAGVNSVPCWPLGPISCT